MHQQTRKIRRFKVTTPRPKGTVRYVRRNVTARSKFAVRHKGGRNTLSKRASTRVLLNKQTPLMSKKQRTRVLLKKQKSVLLERDSGLVQTVVNFETLVYFYPTDEVGNGVFRFEMVPRESGVKRSSIAGGGGEGAGAEAEAEAGSGAGAGARSGSGSGAGAEAEAEAEAGSGAEAEAGSGSGSGSVSGSGAGAEAGSGSGSGSGAEAGASAGRPVTVDSGSFEQSVMRNNALDVTTVPVETFREIAKSIHKTPAIRLQLIADMDVYVKGNADRGQATLVRDYAGVDKSKTNGDIIMEYGVPVAARPHKHLDAHGTMHGFAHLGPQSGSSVNEFNTVTAQNAHTTNAGVVHFLLPLVSRPAYVVGGVQWQLVMTFDARAHAPPNVDIGNTQATLKFITVNQTDVGSNPQRAFVREMAHIIANCVCKTGVSAGHFADQTLDHELKTRMRWKLASQCIFDDAGLWSDEATRGMFNMRALKDKAFAMVMMPDTAQYSLLACTHVASGMNDEGVVTGIPLVKGIWLDKDMTAATTGGYRWPAEGAREQHIRCAFKLPQKVGNKKRSPARLPYMEELSAHIGEGSIFPVRQLTPDEEAWATSLLSQANVPSIIREVLDVREAAAATAAAATAAAAAEVSEVPALIPAERLSVEEAKEAILKGITAYARRVTRVPFVAESSIIVDICAAKGVVVTYDEVKSQVKLVRGKLDLVEDASDSTRNREKSASAYTISDRFFSYLAEGTFPQGR